MGETRRSIFEKETSMASPTLNGRERDQEANGHAWSDQELRDANRHMHDFLDLLGHELRSPLNAIRNALRLLEQLGHDPSTREWGLAVMERQTQCIGRLIEEMQEVSRIKHGKIQLRKQPLDLAQAVAQAIETVRTSVRGRGHQLYITLPPEPVALDADPVRLEQVLTNLLNNATKYMDPGGCIWISVEREESEAVLRVRDGGVGIAPEMLPHIFEPFWQVERTLDHSQGGLGIGLALVRKLAELHGGSASAYSAGLGHGSEFVVRLPARVELPADVGSRGQGQDACAVLR
jgi:signal transduction histidine kinase